MNWHNTSGKYFTASLSMSEVYTAFVSDFFSDNYPNQIMGCEFNNNQYLVSAFTLSDSGGSAISYPEYFYAMVLGIA